MLRYRKIRDGYVIRSPARFDDVAKIYGDDAEALALTKTFCASAELVGVSRKILSLLEVLLSADHIDQRAFTQVANRRYLNELCKELHKVIRKTE